MAESKTNGTTKKLAAVRAYFGANALGQPVSPKEARDYMKEYGREAWNELAQFSAAAMGLTLVATT